jgi:hypothetical protein
VPAAHVITNCIAFDNVAKGFTDNGQEGDFSLSHNTAWNNGDVGFRLASSKSTVKDSIAVTNKGTTGSSAQVDFSGSQTTSGNSWQDGKTWSDGSFKSVDTKLVKGVRQASGKIAASEFLLPKTGTLGATTHW